MDEDAKQPAETISTALAQSLRDWGALVRAVILIAATFFCAGVFLHLIVPILAPTGFRFTLPVGTSITFEKAEESIRFDNVLVDPRGWTDSLVDVTEGDHVTLIATGSVQIGLARLVEAMNEMSKVKSRNGSDPSKERSRSMDKFTDEELQRSLAAYPWSRPTGFDEGEMSSEEVRQSAANSRKKRIVPTATLGQLIAVIDPSYHCPARRHLVADQGPLRAHTYVDNPTKFVAGESGRLCLIVNDITEIPASDETQRDRLEDNVAWQDNIGFYAVRIQTRTPPKKG